MYNGVLKLHLLVGATIIGFVDDIVIVIVAKCLAQMEINATKTVTKKK